MVKDNRPIGGVTLHNIERARARFLPPTKIICWSTIGSSLELVFLCTNTLLRTQCRQTD